MQCEIHVEKNKVQIHLISTQIIHVKISTWHTPRFLVEPPIFHPNYTWIPRDVPAGNGNAGTTSVWNTLKYIFNHQCDTNVNVLQKDNVINAMLEQPQFLVILIYY